MTAARATKRKEAVYFERAPVALIAIQVDTLQVIATNELGSKWIFPGSEGRKISEYLREGGTSTGGVLSCSLRDTSGVVREVELVSQRTWQESVAVIAIRDTREVVRRPEQLRQSQKMEAMGMLAGGIAHDFNNLLTIISGYSQMLQSSSQMKTERDRTAIEQVLKACERAAQLTTQLLSFSRQQVTQTRIVDINQVVDQTAGMLRRLIGEHIDLRIHTSPDAGKTRADESMIQQVLMNLAINARDAMPNGGTLLIHTRAVDLGPDYIGQNFRVNPGSYVALEVRDTGIGMDEPTLKRVFEPFFTTKEQGKGTGLGLATVYGIVRQCNGSVDVYSEPSHGTTFRIFFPRAEGAVSVARASTRVTRGGHETLLLVEDEEAVRKMVLATLQRAGYNVLVAASGPEALDIMHAHQGPIDLMITDMVMPKMSGRELARRLAEERPRTGVLFISGYPDQTFYSNDENEAPPFLQKPFAPSDLTSKVREMLDAIKGGNGASITA